MCRTHICTPFQRRYNSKVVFCSVDQTDTPSPPSSLSLLLHFLIFSFSLPLPLFSSPFCHPGERGDEDHRGAEEASVSLRESSVQLFGNPSGRTWAAAGLDGVQNVQANHAPGAFKTGGRALWRIPARSFSYTNTNSFNNHLSDVTFSLTFLFDV